MYPNYQLGNVSNMHYTKPDYDLFRYTLSKCEINGAPGYSLFGANGYTVCERWHTFSNFLEDLTKIKNSQAYFYNRSEYELVIVNGAKEFNVDNCEFVSKGTNSRIRSGNNREGKYSQYTGVTMDNGSYQVFASINGYKYYLGRYDNEIAAANIYNAIVFACTNDKNNLNSAPFMPIYECLKHKTSRSPINIPDKVHIIEIDEYNKSTRKYKGIKNIKGSNYYVQFNYNKTTYGFGSFDSAVAAANAYNWYASHVDKSIKLNDLSQDETMPVEEWLNHRVYGSASKYKQRVPMTKLTNESKENRDKRCLEHYGMIFE